MRVQKPKLPRNTSVPQREPETPYTGGTTINIPRHFHNNSNGSSVIDRFQNYTGSVEPPETPEEPPGRGMNDILERYVKRRSKT